MDALETARCTALLRPATQRMSSFQDCLLGLGQKAWQKTAPSGLHSICCEIGFLCSEEDVQKACAEATEQNAEAAEEIAVCNFLAHVCGAKPTDQNFSPLRDDDELPCAIEDAAQRGIVISQLEAVLRFIEALSRKDGVIAGWFDREREQAAIKFREANHYQIAEWIIKPITAESSTSYVEAVSVEAAAQKPAWFISHWWGEAVRDFVKSIAKHLDVRGLPPFETAYWVCAYAINQRELDLELAQDLVEMPFSRAMAKVKGVLLILDSKATSLSRAWCLLEVTMQGAGGCGRKLEPAGQEPSDTFLTSEPEKAESEPTQSTATPYPLLDLASVRTEVRGGTAELLTDGLTDVEMDWEEKHPGMGHIGKTDREQNFPLEVIEAGMRVDAAAAEATKPGDSARVFNALVGRSAEADGASLQAVNKHLHSVFARAGLSQALRRHAEMSAFLAALVADTTQQELRLPCLSHVLEDANAFVADLGRAVVALQELRRLELDFGWQSVHSDGLIGKLSDVDELGRGVGQLANLRHFTLRLSGCRKLADLTELGRGIGQLVNLTHLELLLIGCEGVRDIAELGRGVGHLVNLTHLDMVITGSKSLADIKDLGFSIRHLQSLVHLKLHVSGCPNLHYVVELGKSIRFLPNLKHLELDLSFCTHLKDIAHLGRSIRMLTEQWADFGQPKHGSVFTLNIEKSGLKIDRQGTTFFDEPKQFISALGRAAYDDAVEEAEDNPPVPLPRVPWKPDACSHEESEAIKREFRVPLGIQGNM